MPVGRSDVGAATERRFPALGTTAVVLVDEPAVLEAATEAVRSEVQDFDRACSRFRADSELTAVNHRSGETVAISALLAEAIAVSLRAADATGGRVDPTIGSALRSLGYDCDFRSVPPNGPPLELTIRRPGRWQTVVLDAGAGTVTLPVSTELDLGATAKALCADRAAARASHLSGAGVLVGLGGDIATAGPPPQEGWPVLVTDDHATDPGSYGTGGPDPDGQVIDIFSGGLATSGTTRRRWIRGGIELHHLIDPATGRPAVTCWRTTSVAAASCVDANIAATAAIILGREAPAWLEARGLPARLVGGDGAVTTTGGWPAPDDRSHEARG